MPEDTAQLTPVTSPPLMAAPQPSEPPQNGSSPWTTDNRPAEGDAQASEIEYWASLLRDQPPSAEYLKAHKIDPNDVTPEGLSRMERDIEALVDEAREGLKNEKELNVQHISMEQLKKHLETLVTRDDEERYGHVKDIVAKLKARAGDDTTSIGELVELGRQFYEAEVDWFLEKAHKKAILINDIRTGHATKSFLDRYPEALGEKSSLIT